MKWTLAQARTPQQRQCSTHPAETRRKLVGRKKPTSSHQREFTWFRGGNTNTAEGAPEPRRCGSASGGAHLMLAKGSDGPPTVD
jgi:hypothetical protein